MFAARAVTFLPRGVMSIRTPTKRGLYESVNTSRVPSSRRPVPPAWGDAMRLTWKLAVIVAIGVGIQLLLPRFVEEIDETQFAIRVLVAKWQGGSSGDPDVIALATQ